MTSKVTIIVPIYNTSALLHRCLDAIKGQTLKDIEILLINDGSIDNSEDICRTYTNEDSRFKYWYKENGGLSSARNYGIQRAAGEYIFYLDSDDYISNEACQILYEEANTYQVDLLNFGYTYIDAKKIEEKRSSVFPKNTVFKENVVHELLKKDTLQNKLLWFSCFYFYRTEYVLKNELFFNESVLLGEDTDYNLRSLLCAERIYSISNNLYYYVYNTNSLTQFKYKEQLLEKFNSQFNARLQVHKDYNLFTGDYLVEIARNYIEHSLFELFNNEYTNRSSREAFTKIKKIRKDPMFIFCFEHYKYSIKCSRNKKILISLFKQKFFYPLHLFLNIIK